MDKRVFRRPFGWALDRFVFLHRRSWQTLVRATVRRIGVSDVAHWGGEKRLLPVSCYCYGSDRIGGQSLTETTGRAIMLCRTPAPTICVAGRPSVPSPLPLFCRHDHDEPARPRHTHTLYYGVIVSCNASPLSTLTNIYNNWQNTAVIKEWCTYLCASLAERVKY